MHRQPKPEPMLKPAALALTVVALACSPVYAQESKPAPSSAAQQSPQQAMTLQKMVERLRANARAIRSKQADSTIAATAIEKAQGAFQPQAELSAIRGNSRIKNSFEEDLIRKSLGVYERNGTDYVGGVSQLISTGAKLEAKASLSRFTTNTNLLDPTRPPGVLDNRSNYGFSLTQPLARDAGPEVTLARLKVAELDAQASGLAAKDTETSVVGEAMIAYHELTFAQDRVSAARERIANARRLLTEAKGMNKAGRLPSTDVWEVENALDRYQAGLSEALQFELERSNRLRTMLVQTGSVDGLIRTVDPLPEVMDRELSAEQSLRTALDRRDDFRMLKVTVERENTQLGYSRNQRLPRVDVVASYGLNGLAYAWRQSFEYGLMKDYPAWTVGLQMAFPLGRNMQADADIKAALVRLEEAQMGLQALQIQISNDIDTTLTMRTSALERWRLWREVHEREKLQLDAEKTRFRNGRSDTREVLLREERVVNSRLNMREQQLAYARAEVLLQAAQGVLLDMFP